MLAIILSALTVLAVGGSLFLLGRHAGWGWFDRRFHTDVEYVRSASERMFQGITLARSRIVVMGVPALCAGLGVLLTWPAPWGVQIAAGCLFAALGWWGLRQCMDILFARYVRRFESQLVDALIMASNALRVGLSLPQALDIVAKEMPAPVGQEFALTLNEHRMGKNLDDALSDMADRIPSLDLAMVVNAIVILRETGGNLAETFETVVYTFSEREKVKDKISTLTAQGRVQGVILMAMPFVLGYLLNWVNPEYMQPLFTTALGWILLAFMLLMLLAGGLLIRKIVSIEV